MSATPFTSEQLAAVEVSGPRLDTCVVAGPGSGKTTVLVEYFRRLVASGIQPPRILAITFTEKAAANMRKKLAGAFRDSPSIRAQLERAWVSTVHGFCARLLRENAVFAGVDPEFYISLDRESWRRQQECMDDAMESLFQERPAAVRALVRALSSPDFESAVLSAYDAMRGAGVGVAKLAGYAVPQGTEQADIAATLRALRGEPVTDWSCRQKQALDEAMQAAERIAAAPNPLAALHEIEAFSCNLRASKRNTGAYHLLKRMKEQVEEAQYTLITQHFTHEREFLLEILRRFDALYRGRKTAAGALDFPDLEEFAVRLLETRADVRERIRGQFDRILMDEFQDTNGQQARLLELVRPVDSFYAVGDINQSIFGFRHAEPQGFQDYRQAVQAAGRRVVGLAANFRSRPQILRAVETILEGEPGIEPRRLAAGRSFAGERPVCVDILALPEPALEAQWVARRIAQFSREFSWKEIAVLVRNTEVLAGFTAAFDDASIPYVVNRGKGFYESREVNDLAHLLRVIANPRDEISLATVLRSPLVAAGDEALLRLRLIAPAHNMGGAFLRLSAEMAAQFDPVDWEKLTRFRARLSEWRVRREYVSFDRLLLAAIDESGYRPENGGRGAANIDKFLAQAREAAARMSLDEFVAELALVRASNPREPDAPPEDAVNAVQVMTVHSAKGLEFPVVFVAALHKGVESNPPVVAFSRHAGLGARWRNPACRKDKDDLFQHKLRQEWSRREREESSRLLYVAMTRAEEHLVLSFAGKPAHWANTLVEKLDLDCETERDQVLSRSAPDGEEWSFRLLVAARAPDAAAAAQIPAAGPEPRAAPLPLPAVSGQHDSNATVTALARFARCPREYYLSAYLGFEGRPRKLPEDGGDGLSAGEFGTQVHALLAGAGVADLHPEAERLANVFRSSPLGRRIARAARVEREFDFLMAVEDLVIRGQVDLWFEEGGEIAIVDYKTDSVTAAEAHQRAQDYALQLRLYALAVEKVAGRAPSRAWLHFLRPNTLVEISLAPSLLDSPEDAVREFQEAQAKLDFRLVEGEHCKRCQFYKDLCPAGWSSRSESGREARK
jgi:ATP-dependent exoDNAse (exonuclease V) beta subunit